MLPRRKHIGTPYQIPIVGGGPDLVHDLHSYVDAVMCFVHSLLIVEYLYSLIAGSLCVGDYLAMRFT